MKSVRKLSLALVALAALPALAQDTPAGPGAADPPAGPAAPPAPTAPAPAAPAAPAKKERKVDPKAKEVYERYAKMISCPANSGVKEAKFTAEIEAMQLGGTLTAKSRWTAADGVTLELELPEALLAQVPPELAGGLSKMISKQIGAMFAPFFGGLEKESEQYDVAVKDVEGKKILTLTPFAPDSRNESQKLHFAADGLLLKSIEVPRLDPADPRAAMLMGAELETIFKHEKRGESFVISTVETSGPTGTDSLVVKYTDGPSGLALMKSGEISMSGSIATLLVYDWVIDGKAVDGTAKKKAEPAAPAAPEKPVTPATPGPEAGPGAAPGK